MEHTANRAELCGRFVTLPELSHENHGKKFYHFYLEVDRLSGTADILRVVIPEKVLVSADLTDGDMIFVRGQIRSYNEHTPIGHRLRIFLFAEQMECRGGDARNDICLTGTVCTPPIYRRTPMGREICDLMLAVPRGSRRTDYLPCIAWGKTARSTGALLPGSQLALLGRLQSRQYTKVTTTGIENRTTYEISVLSAQFSEDAQNVCIDSH